MTVLKFQVICRYILDWNQHCRFVRAPPDEWRPPTANEYVVVVVVTGAVAIYRFYNAIYIFIYILTSALTQLQKHL